MIEVLNGIRETVAYKGIEGFKMHDNTDCEAYPDHWHTPIEIIMPLENPYRVLCRNVVDPEATLSNIPSALHITPASAPAIHGRLITLMLDIFKEYFSDSILIGASIYSKLIEMLVDPEISITEVAMQSGFSSLSAFIRMFKLIKDCTPTEFKNMYDY